ncbi:hypothetical protein JCM11641_003035 [Rhodosporidiobolus odoratus]
MTADTRSADQRRSLLPSFKPTTSKENPSTRPISSSHHRSQSTPLASTDASNTLPRSRSSWLSAFLRSASETEDLPPAPPPKDAPSKLTAQKSYFFGGSLPRNWPRAGAWDVDENEKPKEKPLPPVLRALSPVAEESFFSPSPLLDSPPAPRLNLQQRLASWEWNGEKKGSVRDRGKESEKKGSRQVNEEAWTIGHNEPQSAPQESSTDEALESPVDTLPPASRNRPAAPLPFLTQALEAVEPEASYLGIAALPSSSASSPFGLVSFANPFSPPPPASSQPANARTPPPRPPSAASTVHASPPSRPLHTIDSQYPAMRKISTVSASVYSQGGSISFSDRDDLANAIYFAIRDCQGSEPLPADPGALLSELAIENAPPVPYVAHAPPLRRASSSATTVAGSLRPPQPRISSVSSTTTTISANPSPLFDTSIFSSPPSCRSTATWSFESCSPLEATMKEEAPPQGNSSLRFPITPPAEAAANPLALDPPSASDRGTWRRDWNLEACMSRYLGGEGDALSVKEIAPSLLLDGESDEELELSREEELDRIYKYCEREAERRRKERHSRWVEERREKGEDGTDVVFGAAL